MKKKNQNYDLLESRYGISKETLNGVVAMIQTFNKDYTFDDAVATYESKLEGYKEYCDMRMEERIEEFKETEKAKRAEDKRKYQAVIKAKDTQLEQKDAELEQIDAQIAEINKSIEELLMFKKKTILNMRKKGYSDAEIMEATGFTKKDFNSLTR